jgi:hypothetical protein
VTLAGLKFGGHVDLEKKVHLTQGARNSPEIWYLREGNVPALLPIQPVGTEPNGKTTAVTAPQAQVLSPLFYIPVDRKALVQAYQSTLLPAPKSEGKVVRESFFLSPDEP